MNTFFSDADHTNSLSTDRAMQNAKAKCKKTRQNAKTNINVTKVLLIKPKAND